MTNQLFVVARETLSHAQAEWHDWWRRPTPDRCRIVPSYPLPPDRRATAILVKGSAGQADLSLVDPGLVGGLLPALDARQRGFDNLPQLSAGPGPWQFGCGVHFLPWLLGARIVQTDPSQGAFSTWVEPLIREPADVRRLVLPDPVTHPYFVALRKGVAAVPPAVQEVFPLQLMGASPLDAAAELLGSTAFYSWFHDHPRELRYLLDHCAEAAMMVAAETRACCRLCTGPFGIPGMYVNDLVTEFLSSAHWREFVIPCYERLARAVGGLVLGADSPDPRVLPSVAAMDGFLGASVHRHVPLSIVQSALAGRGVYLLASYCYEPQFAGPTLHRGTYYNPIIAGPREGWRRVIAELAGKVATLVVIDRPERAMALAAGHALRRQLARA